MTALLILWLGLLVALLAFAVGPPGSGGALTLAYFLDLSLIHVPGVLASFGFGLADPVDTRLGFEITLTGMAAFATGAVAARLTGRTLSPLSGQTSLEIARESPGAIVSGAEFERLGWRTVAIGGGCYLMLSSVLGRLESATAIVSSMPNLMIL